MTHEPADRRAARRLRSPFDRATALVWLGLLAAPSIDALARDAEARGPRRENRAAVPWPGWPHDSAEIAALPRALEARFGDTFGLRDRLLRWRSRLYLEVAGLSPTPQHVLDRSGG